MFGSEIGSVDIPKEVGPDRMHHIFSGALRYQTGKENHHKHSMTSPFQRNLKQATEQTVVRGVVAQAAPKW